MLLSVNTESPFYNFFFVFFFVFCLFLTVLYCNCVKLKYAPCCVVSSLCPNDLICEKTTRPDAKSQKVSGFVLRQVFQWSLCWEWIVGPSLLPSPPPLPILYSICFSPRKKAATGSAGKLEAVVHCPPPTPNPEVSCGNLITQAAPLVWETKPQPTKTHQAAAEKK